MDSSVITADSPRFVRFESLIVFCLLLLFSVILHAPSLFFSSQYVFSPSDIMGRQAELGGDPLYEPANRLLIDPVLQFEPWDLWIRNELSHGRFPFWNPFSGSGVPFAGNGQSRLFDPVKWLFLAAPAPWAWAAESAFRFILTGMGIQALCRFWRLPAATCVFAALSLPLSGFFTLWRIYPLVATGAVVPWFWLAFERLWAKPSAVRASLAGLAVAWLVVSGNVQVAAVGLFFTVFLWAFRRHTFPTAQSVSYSAAAILLGLLLSAPAWASLADYLDQSPIWADRVTEHSGGGRGATSRWADLPTLAVPFLYGSERRGDPNFHKALGAGNANEAASGYVGLVALLLLIPVGLLNPDSRRRPLFRFALSLWLAGLWVAYRLPPVPLVWPHLPVLQGIDPRRFVVAMNFGGVLMAGMGLEAIGLDQISPLSGRFLLRGWLGLALFFTLMAISPLFVSNRIEARALQHYENAVAAGPNHAATVQARVEAQSQAITRAWPAYMLGRAVLLFCIAAAWHFTRSNAHWRVNVMAGLALLELLHFNLGYNPHVDQKWLEQPQKSLLINRLRQLGDQAYAQGLDARFLAVGEALPPNELMRFGLKDLRNYDSIELLRSLEPLDTLFERRPGQDRTSRRPIEWAGVSRCRETLRNLSVIGVVGHIRPPEGLFDDVEEVSPGVWLGHWPGLPRAEGAGARIISDEPGRLRLRMERIPNLPDVEGRRQARGVLLRESFDPGWRLVTLEGGGWSLQEDRATGLMRLLPNDSSQASTVELFYRPQHWGLTLAAFLTGGIICIGWPVLDLTRASKKSGLHFSSPDARR